MQFNILKTLACALAGSTVTKPVMGSQINTAEVKFISLMNGNVSAQPLGLNMTHQSLKNRQYDPNMATIIQGKLGNFTLPLPGTAVINSYKKKNGEIYDYTDTANVDCPTHMSNPLPTTEGAIYRQYKSYQNPIASIGNYRNPCVGVQEAGPRQSVSSVALGQQFERIDEEGNTLTDYPAFPYITPEYEATNVRATQGADGEFTSVVPDRYTSVTSNASPTPNSSASPGIIPSLGQPTNTPLPGTAPRLNSKSAVQLAVFGAAGAALAL